MSAANDAIVIREATPDDVPAIFTLLNGMYARKWPMSFYRWQCFNDVVPSVLLCAFADGELVATFGVQKRRLAGGLTCGQASWLNVAPGWQRRGLFTKLGTLACAHFSDLDAICVFANQNATTACERGLGFRMIGTVPLMVLPGAAVNGLPAPAGMSVERAGSATQFPVLDRDPPGTLTFEYPAAYRAWRYANPAFEYEKVALSSGEYAMIKTFTDPVTGSVYGDLVDMSCASWDEDVISQLVSGACHRLAERGAASLTTWALSGLPLRRVAERLGFREGSHRSYFGLRVLNPLHDALYAFSHWHLRQADATNY